MSKPLLNSTIVTVGELKRLLEKVPDNAIIAACHAGKGDYFVNSIKYYPNALYNLSDIGEYTIFGTDGDCPGSDDNINLPNQGPVLYINDI